MKSFEEINKKLDELLVTLTGQQKQLNKAEKYGNRSDVQRCADQMYDTRMQITTLHWVIGD